MVVILRLVQARLLVVVLRPICIRLRMGRVVVVGGAIHATRNIDDSRSNFNQDITIGRNGDSGSSCPWCR